MYTIPSVVLETSSLVCLLVRVKDQYAKDLVVYLSNMTNESADFMRTIVSTNHSYRGGLRLEDLMQRYDPELLAVLQTFPSVSLVN